MFLHYFGAIQYVWWESQHLNSDLCHQRAQSDAAHEYRSGSFYSCGGAEDCTAQRLRLPPLCCALCAFCGCWRWRCLKTGIRLVLWRCQPPLHSSASFEGKKSRHETCQAETGEQPQPLFNCMWFRGGSPCFASVFMYCIIRRTVILHSWLSLLWRTH